MSLLFTPGRIGTIETRNRFVSSATVECLTTDNNRLSEKYYRVYERLAKRNVGLIIPGNYFVNGLGRAVDKNMVIDNDDVLEDLTELTTMVHSYGAKIVGQINHGGRQCPEELIGQRPIAPSRIKDSLTGTIPRAMTESEIISTIEDFASAAWRVKAAGFDGVQINGGHGYLVSEFLSSYTNRRKDMWGGSLDNRIRFLKEIYRAIRGQVGMNFPILIKINSQDQIKGGITIDESILICKRLEALGFNAIEVSGGIKETGFATTKGDVPHDLIMKNLSPIKRFFYPFFKGRLEKAARFSEGFYLDNAARIKESVSIPVLAVGGMRRRKSMEEALKNRRADFISLCRPFIRQPNLVWQMEKDPESDPINCVNCNRCTYEITVNYKPLRCYYNPVTAS